MRTVLVAGAASSGCEISTSQNHSGLPSTLISQVVLVHTGLLHLHKKLLAPHVTYHVPEFFGIYDPDPIFVVEVVLGCTVLEVCLLVVLQELVHALWLVDLLHVLFNHVSSVLPRNNDLLDLAREMCSKHLLLESANR